MAIALSMASAVFSVVNVLDSVSCNLIGVDTPITKYFHRPKQTCPSLQIASRYVRHI